MLLVTHVDEVADDQPAQIAQSQLPGDLDGRFHVALERGLLGALLFAVASAVDVDRDQRLGLLDHDRAAALQIDRARLNFGDLPLDLVLVKQRDFAVVMRQFGLQPRHGDRQEVLDLPDGAVRVADDLVDLAVEHLSLIHI